MITIRKLSRLPAYSALRKAARLLQGFEVNLASNTKPDLIYLRDLINYISTSSDLSLEERNTVIQIKSDFEKNSTEILRTCNNLRHLLLKHLNEQPADWDLLPPNGTVSGKRLSHRGTNRPLEVFLDDIRSPFNVGSIFRSSESFGVSKILLSKGTSSPTHKRAVRTSMGCTDIIPWEYIDCQDLAGKNIFALELNGISIDQFEFPESGLVIIGSEELGICPECLKLADDSFGRVSIPLGGSKGSINVSVAFGILMYNWYNRVVGANG